MSVQPKRLELDSNVRRSSHGTALIGGSPFRVIRLSHAGARLVDSWLAGAEVSDTPESAKLLTQLVAAGMLHPVVEAHVPTGLQIAFVIPAYDDAAGLREVLTAVRHEFTDALIVVVDDASPDAAAVETAADGFDVELLVHERNRGPAAARNTGWRSVADRSDIVVFLDSDVVPSPGAIATMLAHFEDGNVVAVAPRVAARPGTSTIDRYEVTNSPLDMGPDAARVRPRARVSYVPSAALAVRVADLDGAGGFDESMRVGEDVDLVWRLGESLEIIRYEPRAVAHHRNRASLRAMLRQRFDYGSSAAALAQRHPGQVVPLEMPIHTAAIMAAAAIGPRNLRLAAGVAAIASAFPLARKLDGKVDEPVAETARLVSLTHAHAAKWTASAVMRAWLPLFVLTRRGRRIAAAAALVPPAIEWAQANSPLDPVRAIAIKAADDIAYCAGVWRGAVDHRILAPLLPRLRRDRSSQ